MEPTNDSQSATDSTSESAESLSLNTTEANPDAPQSESAESEGAFSASDDQSKSEPAQDAKDEAAKPAAEPDIQPAASDAADDHAADNAPTSATDLIAHSELRLTEIAQRIDEERAAVTALSNAAARTTTTADAVRRIAEHQQQIKDLDAERSAIEGALAPLRAAVADVEAEKEAEAEEAERTELAGELGVLLNDAEAAAKEMEQAVAALVTIARRRRELRSRWREVLAQVVLAPQPRGMIIGLAEPLFTETPTLEQFLTLDKQLLAGSGAYAQDRAQRVRDRIAEATA